MKPLFWIPGAPDNWSGNEDCLSINKPYTWDKSWNDINCNWKQQFICKFKTGTDLKDPLSNIL